MTLGQVNGHTPEGLGTVVALSNLHTAGEDRGEVG